MGRSHGAALSRDTTLPVVVERAYAFTLWTVRKVESFPRSHRFQLGDRLVASSLELLTLLVDAAYSRDKRPSLEQANRQLNRLRLLYRLAKDLRLVSVDGYSFAAESLEEVGRMVGGWTRATST